MGEMFSCHKISEGTARGEVLISSDPILFYHTDPVTGVVTEPGHALEGKSVKDKILVFPGGKGSSVVQLDGMYRLDKYGTAPKALIVRTLDTVLVSSAIIMGMPMINRVENGFYAAVRDGDCVQLDTYSNTIEIMI